MKKGSLEEILFPKQLLKTAKNKIEHGIKSLESEIGKYTESAKKYFTNARDKIKEKVETAKEVVPYVLISSNMFGRMGYIGSMLLIYSMSKGGTGGGWYSKIPTIAGIILSVVSLATGLYSLHLDQELQHQLQVTRDNYNITLTQIQKQLEYINGTLTEMKNNLNNSSYISTITQMQQQLQYINDTLTRIQNNLGSDNITITQMQQQLQEINITLTQLQNYYTLEGILFGNNNPNGISVISINSVQIENGTAYVQGTVYSSGANVILKIPIGYVEKGNNNVTVTIQDFVNAAKQDGWQPYVVLNKGDLKYLSLSNNQNGTYVIAIQPNKPVNIGIMASPAGPSTIQNVLNNLNNYDMVIQDNYTVWGLSNALWGYASGNSVVVDFSNNYQYNLAENMISIADQIINSPGNPNPTSSGIIYTYSIFNGTVSTYQNYTEYNVGQKYIPVIVLEPEEGESIV